MKVQFCNCFNVPVVSLAAASILPFRSFKFVKLSWNEAISSRLVSANNQLILAIKVYRVYLWKVKENVIELENLSIWKRWKCDVVFFKLVPPINLTELSDRCLKRHLINICSWNALKDQSLREHDKQLWRLPKTF